MKKLVARNLVDSSNRTDKSVEAAETPVVGDQAVEAGAETTPWRARLLGWCGTQALRLCSATWRVQATGWEILDRCAVAGEPHLLVFWHAKYVPLFRLFAGRKICVVTSRSARGDVIADVSRRFGYSIVQLRDRGKFASLDRMRAAMLGAAEVGVAVDGPFGPYHVVKRGAIQLAAQGGYRIVPVSVASRPKWVFAQRWDDLEIPLPFARVALVIGPPLPVPEISCRSERREWTQRVHDALAETDRQAEASLARARFTL